MKSACIILARCSSSRLPGKMLKEIVGKTILQHITDRLRLVSNSSQVIVATSNHSSDDAIKDYCDKHNVLCYRGSLDNVAERFLSAAEFYKIDFAVRINGDNLFADHKLISQMIDTAVKNNCDFVTNAPGRTFPYGMSVEVIKTNFYRKAYSNFFAPRHFEHVTTWLYDHPEFGNRSVVQNTIIPEAKEIQLAVDTPQDLELADKMMKILKNLDERIGFREIFHAYQTAKYGVHS
jgi:spore coat polysaccharide biosynthesis protein SpsF